MTASPEGGELPRLHIVTNDVILRAHGFCDRAERMMDVGRARIALHIRGPGLSGRELYDRAERCTAIGGRTGSWIFVNDRLDIALACAARGVQLGRRSVPIGGARALLGAGATIGASVHDRPAAESAAREGADFVLAGTLYESASHPARAPAGVDWFGGLPLPVIGIGGVSVARVGDVRRAGAFGVAAIRGIWHAERPVAALEAYLSELE